VPTRPALRVQDRVVERGFGAPRRHEALRQYGLAAVGQPQLVAFQLEQAFRVGGAQHRIQQVAGAIGVQALPSLALGVPDLGLAELRAMDLIEIPFAAGARGIRHGHRRGFRLRFSARWCDLGGCHGLLRLGRRLRRRATPPPPAAAWLRRN